MRHEIGYFSSDGVELFEQHWLPEGRATGVVLLVHGYAEHSERYVHVAQFLTDRGYAFEAYDLRGHGQSEGSRVFVRSVDEHLADLQNVLSRVRERYPGLPLFLLGHSMGGAIVALFVIRTKPDVRGVVLSGPALTSKRKTPRFVQRLFLIIGRLFPKVHLGKLPSADVSRDPEVVKAYDADPLVYRNGMPAGTLAAMIRAGREIHASMEDFSAPALLLLHGEADNLTDPAGSRELFERASTVDKQLKIYEGLYHEIFNEPERNQVLADLVAWLDARRDPPG
jgi:acylglycerol lipase